MKMRRKFKVVVDGKEYVVEIEEIQEGSEQKTGAIPVVQQPTYEVKEEKVESKGAVPEGAVVAPMPGKILDIKVSKGDRVNAGDVVAILEAMKMENEIVAPKDGVVEDIAVNVGDNVERGAVIMRIG